MLHSAKEGGEKQNKSTSLDSVKTCQSINNFTHAV